MTILKKIWLIIFIILAVVSCGLYAYKHVTEDPDGPVITVEKESIKVSVTAGDDALLRGITATDAADGDVTDSLLVDSMSNLYDGNKRMVTYAAFDSDQNVTKVEREIVYKDYTSPHFTQLASFRFAVGESIDLTSLVTATDCIDGDVTGQIIISDQIGLDNKTEGEYEIEYSVKNSCGDTSYLPITIEVYEYEVGMMDLDLSAYLLYLEKGEEEPDYTSYMTALTYGTTVYLIGEDENLYEADRTVTLTENGVSYVQAAEDADLTLVERGVCSYESDVDTSKAGVYTVRLTYEGTELYGEEVMTVVVE